MTLQHVALEVGDADLDGEVAFWALLGFAEVGPPPGLDGRSRWMARGATQVHLLVAGAPVVPPYGHVAVVCESWTQTCATLVAAGRPPEPREPHWGAERAFVRSPAGHRVELMAASPG